jgi:hypothetical protein
MRARLLTLLAALLIGAGTLAGPGAAPVSAATRVTARTLLYRTTVANESGWSTYNRALFNYPADLNGDCQNTRAEVLIAESRLAVTYTTSRHCYVKKGRWYSYYDGVWGSWASSFELDHVVPLFEAWISGARSWTASDRRRFANDSAYGPSLAIVTSAVNQSKGEKDPASWLPPRAGARCQYAIWWVQVKYRWRLTMDSAERSALSRILSGTCGARIVNLPARGR